MTTRRIISATSNTHYESDILQIDSFVFREVIKPPQSPALGTEFVFSGLAVLMCLSGECVVKVYDIEYTLRENQILIIMPYRIVSIQRYSNDCLVEGFFLGLDYYTKNNIAGPDYDIIMQLRRHSIVKLTDIQMCMLMNLHSVILDRCSHMNIYGGESLNSLVFSFMAEIKCLYERNTVKTSETVQTRQEKITDDFFILLVSNFREQRSVSFYADKLCLTPKYLSTVIKKVTGHTINVWINEMVINHVKTLLKATDKTVLEISEDMNFSSPSFFGRYFKQYTGLTPLQFRKQ